MSIIYFVEPTNIFNWSMSYKMEPPFYRSDNLFNSISLVCVDGVKMALGKIELGKMSCNRVNIL